jgi:hypothetical protein
MKKRFLIATLLLFGLLFASPVVPVLAASDLQPTPEPKLTQSQRQEKNQARKEARKAYLEAIKKANQDYKTAVADARKKMQADKKQAWETYQAALKSATDKNARIQARKTYLEAIKKANQDYKTAVADARKKMQADKKQAWETYQAALKSL